MHNKEQITKEAVIEPTRIHMLSNEERLRYDIAPKERLALMDEDTYYEFWYSSHFLIYFLAVFLYLLSNQEDLVIFLKEP